MVLGPIKVGGFSAGDTLTAAEMTTANTEIQQALDGAAGGAYSPTAVLAIGGEGIANTELADTTALKAVDTTSLTDGAYRHVTGLGRYRLDKTGSGASDTEDLPLVVTPTTGGGTWFAEDARACKQYKATFTASGTWTCPRNLALALVELWAGGGAGAAGYAAASGQGATAHDFGGGGGGAGQRVLAVVAVTPATAYAAHIGAGGTGGISTGGDGGQTYLGSLVAAIGGQGGQLGSSSAPTATLAPGGVRGGAGILGPAAGQTLTGSLWPVNIGDGGYCTTAGPQSAAGGWSELGVAGGSAGTAGTTSTNGGGLGGGGGGGGPGGAGGSGGNGGNGTNAAAASTNYGAAGGAAAANSGAGGGGGGGGGSPSSGTGTAGNGGNGGSGQIIIRGFALATASA